MYCSPESIISVISDVLKPDFTEMKKKKRGTKITTMKSYGNGKTLMSPKFFSQRSDITSMAMISNGTHYPTFIFSAEIILSTLWNKRMLKLPAWNRKNPMITIVR